MNLSICDPDLHSEYTPGENQFTGISYFKTSDNEVCVMGKWRVESAHAYTSRISNDNKTYISWQAKHGETVNFILSKEPDL